MGSKGGASFWRRSIADRIERGEVYLAGLAGHPVGTFVLQWSDEETWGRAPDAGYVHGLAVRRKLAGKGPGRELLGRAANVVAASGKSTSGSTAWRIMPR